MTKPRTIRDIQRMGKSLVTNIMVTISPIAKMMRNPGHSYPDNVPPPAELPKIHFSLKDCTIANVDKIGGEEIALSRRNPFSFISHQLKEREDESGDEQHPWRLLKIRRCPVFLK